MRFKSCGRLLIVLLVILLSTAALPAAAQGAATTYYVSNSGEDGQDGRSPENAWASVGRVNAADLQPGDRVLFACGDVWRGEMLTLTASGQAGSPITIDSYPDGCADKPVLSGAQPITGWIPNGFHATTARASTSTRRTSCAPRRRPSTGASG